MLNYIKYILKYVKILYNKYCKNTEIYIVVLKLSFLHKKCYEHCIQSLSMCLKVIYMCSNWLQQKKCSVLNTHLSKHIQQMRIVKLLICFVSKINCQLKHSEEVVCI